MNLYRGMTKDGKWVEGDHLELLDGTHVIVQEAAQTVIGHPHYPAVLLGQYSFVIPETVGQSTGRKDKNGRDIFAGDIVRGTRKQYAINVDGWGRDLPARCQHCNPEPPPIDVSDIYVVEYDNGAFFLQRNPVKGKFSFYYNDAIEVIGNQTDNPELLE